MANVVTSPSKDEFPALSTEVLRGPTERHPNASPTELGKASTHTDVSTNLKTDTVSVKRSVGAWKSNPQIQCNWAALRHFQNVTKDGILTPPLELLIAGANFWASALVGVFWSKRIAFPVVKDWAKARWGKKGLEKVMLWDDDSFIFKFNSESNIPEILEQGPWLVSGQPLFIQRWRPGFDFNKGKTEIPLWVEFHNVPLEYWSVDGLSFLASSIGKPISMDVPTANMERVCYAKICIEVRRDTILPDILPIMKLGENGELVKSEVNISYPWKPTTGKKTWQTMGNKFKTWNHSEIIRFGEAEASKGEVVDSPMLVVHHSHISKEMELGGKNLKQKSIMKERMLEANIPLVKGDILLSGNVDAVNGGFDAIECSMVDVAGVVPDIVPVGVVKNSRSVEDVISKECVDGEVMLYSAIGKEIVQANELKNVVCNAIEVDYDGLENEVHHFTSQYLEHCQMDWVNMLTPLATVGQNEISKDRLKYKKQPTTVNFSDCGVVSQGTRNTSSQNAKQKIGSPQESSLDLVAEDSDFPSYAAKIPDNLRDFCVQSKIAKKKSARKKKKNPKYQ